MNKAVIKDAQIWSELSSLTQRLGLLVALVAPIKLSWSYAALSAFLISWLYDQIKSKGRTTTLKDLIVRLINPISELPKALNVPLMFWVMVASISSCFGFDVIKSQIQLMHLVFLALSLALFYDLVKKVSPIKVLSFLVVGQSIAALHSIAEPFLPIALHSLLIGKVTESGQLALTLPLALGLFLYTAKNSKRSECIKFLISIVLLSLALLINLKRGPWLGASLAVLLILSRYHKRFVIPIALTIILLALQYQPVRTRIEQSYRDYMILGGRNVMWQIGLELAAKHPLGVGYDNSVLMRDFERSIPHNHRHMHNNYLNILVETGWLGLSVFLWWIYSILALAFKSGAGVLSFAIGSAVLSWQIAGLVEYNFGDSEVMLVLYIMLACLGSLRYSNLFNDNCQNSGKS